jgi:hypothetical protein
VTFEPPLKRLQTFDVSFVIERCSVRIGDDQIQRAAAGRAVNRPQPCVDRFSFSKV